MIIETDIKSKKWLEIDEIDAKIDKIARKIVKNTQISEFLKNKKNILQINFSLISDLQIKRINQEFRGKNSATDVLSFSFLDENLIRKNGLKSVLDGKNFVVLGDVLLAFEFIKKAAFLKKISFENHLTHLIAHGILHLIGFDHEDEKEAKIMEEIEVEILEKFNIENPYLCQ